MRIAQSAVLRKALAAVQLDVTIKAGPAEQVAADHVENRLSSKLTADLAAINLPAGGLEIILPLLHRRSNRPLPTFFCGLGQATRAARGASLK